MYIGARADTSQTGAFLLAVLAQQSNLMQLAAMMGHGALPVLQRYLRFLADDLEEAHRAHGPVNSLLTKGRKR